MADSPDVETLKRKGRRRLVGAIALVFAAVIVLPMVFDSEPKRPPPVSVRIPSEDDPAFRPKVVPKSPAIEPSKAVESKSEPKAETKAEPKSEVKAEPKAEPKPEPKAEPAPKPVPKKPEPLPDAERKRAEAALAGGGQFVVPVAALSTPEKLKELVDTLSAAKLPHYTEPVATTKGTVTRVRVGPFQSKEAAQQALEKLQSMGLKPGNVISRP
jgi:DedD protein